MPGLVACLECGSPISQNARVCPICGDPEPVRRVRKTNKLTRVVCYWCKGSGLSSQCTWCNGTGKYKQTFMYQGQLYEGHSEPCDMCGGSGNVNLKCQYCAGRGVREESSEVECVETAKPVDDEPLNANAAGGQ